AEVAASARTRSAAWWSNSSASIPVWRKGVGCMSLHSQGRCGRAGLSGPVGPGCLACLQQPHGGGGSSWGAASFVGAKRSTARAGEQQHSHHGPAAAAIARYRLKPRRAMNTTTDTELHPYYCFIPPAGQCRALLACRSLGGMMLGSLHTQAAVPQ